MMGRVGASLANTLGRGRLVLGWLLAIAGNAALTAALLPLERGPAPTYEAMLYLALAVLTALAGGLLPALVCSLVAMLAIDYWLVEPLHSLDVASGGDVLLLVAFAAVSVGVSFVVDSAARQRERATEARTEADALAGLNRQLLAGTYDIDGLLGLVRTRFGARSVELLPDDSFVAFGDTVADAGAHTILVLREVSLEPRERRLLDAFATHLGVVRDREQLSQQTAAARALGPGDTSTTFVEAVSRDLRAPLAGLRAAAGTLRRHGERLSPADRAELLEEVDTSTARLSGMVADLLDLSRLQAGSVTPVLAPTPLDPVVEAVLEALSGGERVRVVPPLPDVIADAGLLDRVLVNLVGYALRHTDGAVELCGVTDGQQVMIAVVDHGAGVPAARREAIFEPFQRSGEAPDEPENRGDAAELGLTVARGLVEAQGGAVTVEDTPDGGLTMVVGLPAASAEQ
jgi:K+-sensing histidine kinase KdpD